MSYLIGFTVGYLVLSLIFKGMGAYYLRGIWENTESKHFEHKYGWKAELGHGIICNAGIDIDQTDKDGHRAKRQAQHWNLIFNQIEDDIADGTVNPFGNPPTGKKDTIMSMGVELPWVGYDEKEDAHRILSTIREILYINYGHPGAICKGLVSEDQRTDLMLITVLEWYQDRLNGEKNECNH